MFRRSLPVAAWLISAVMGVSIVTVAVTAWGLQGKGKTQKKSGTRKGSTASKKKGTPKKKATPPSKMNGAPAAMLKVVKQFEEAYKRKDKQTMLMSLMNPTQDKMALEKRYQWLRGYGPHDLPGSVHPPILFQAAAGSNGSFVPTAYSILSAKPGEKGLWDVQVREEGTYRDEDGRYKVSRIRHFTMMKTGKSGDVSLPYTLWYVLDYYLAENKEEYGFYVDDISDKMTKVK